MVRYLDAFSKEFGENKILGEGFITSVVNLQFSTATSAFLFIRTAIFACQLIAPKHKVIDGHARLFW